MIWDRPSPQRRDTRRHTVELSAAGREILPRVRQALDAVDGVRRMAAAGRTEIVGRVTIGFADSSSRYAVPTLARSVRAEQPGIELVLRSQIHAGLALTEVAAGRLDFGFARTPVLHEEIDSHLYAYEHLVAAVPSDHRLADQPAIHVADLKDEPFVTFPPDRGSIVRDYLFRVARQAGFQPRIVQDAPDSNTVLALVAAGVGVTITVSSVQHITTPRLVFRPLSEHTDEIGVVLVWRRGNESPPVRAVIDIARRVLPTPEIES